MRRLFLLSIVVLAMLAPTGGKTATGGCSVVSVWTLVPGHCRYTASGPGTFTALTVNNWRIEVSKDLGLTWVTLAASHEAHEFDPTTISIWEPASGTFPSVAGDLVNLEIGHEHLCSNDPGPCTLELPQAGFITATG